MADSTWSNEVTDRRLPLVVGMRFHSEASLLVEPAETNTQPAFAPKGKYFPAVVGLLIAICVVVFGASRSASAQGPNRAGLVIRYGDDAVETFCVQFEADEISGLDLLLRAGVPVVYSTSGLGAMICKIGDAGCNDPANCLCQCRGARCLYWSYWRLVDGVWQYSNVGASNFKVKTGMVDGWTWGVGTVNAALAPPVITLEEICRPTPTPTSIPTATPTTTLTPTATPTPTEAPSGTPASRISAAPSATHIPTSTATPVPAPTNVPTGAPTSTPTEAQSPSATARPSVAAFPTPGGSALSRYWGFAALLGLLLLIGWMVSRRKVGR